MKLEEAFKILEGDPELQCKYGNDGDGCINPQIAKDEAILTIQNYIEFQTITKKKIEDKINRRITKLYAERDDNLDYASDYDFEIQLWEEMKQELLEEK